VERQPIALRDQPGGRVVTKLGPTTEFGDPTALTVVKRRGRWLGVKAAQLPNRQVGWVARGSASLRLSRTRTWLKVELGRRRLQLRRGSRVIEQVRVGIGRPQSPTPRGTFSVTDKLPGARFGRYYGRFILALSGRQPRTPPGWPGGDRLAIHGTDNPSRIGEQTSAGCVVASNTALDKLVEEVPQGAPVVIED
jgi:lipoprotein-anchoring transpeptidase ErfK/SrfK